MRPMWFYSLVWILLMLGCAGISFALDVVGLVKSAPVFFLAGAVAVFICTALVLTLMDHDEDSEREEIISFKTGAE